MTAMTSAAVFEIAVLPADAGARQIERRAGLVLEPALKQGHQGRHRLSLVITFDSRANDRTWARCEQHDAHDRLGVDLTALGKQERLASERCQGLHDLGRGLRVQAQRMGDR